MPATLGQCAAVDAFDSSRLPYLWLPGLPARRLANEAYHAAVAKNELIEVAHRHDENAASRRFTWLYAAPGSGVWWKAGRTTVAENVLEAAVRWHGISAIAAFLDAEGRRAGNHGWLHERKKMLCPRCSWSSLLRPTAQHPHTCCAADSASTQRSGSQQFVLEHHNSSYWRGSVAIAADFIEPFLTPPPGIDSVVLVSQRQHWGGHRFMFPEIIDFRAAPASHTSKFDSQKDRRGRGQYSSGLHSNLFRDKEGHHPCNLGTLGEECTSCGWFMHALCKCAHALEPPGPPKWNARHEQQTRATGLKACCERWMGEKVYRVNRTSGYSTVYRSVHSVVHKKYR